MLRQILIVSLILALFAAPAYTAGPQEAFTKDGKVVILNPDGTWKYKQGQAGGMMGDASPGNSPGTLRFKDFFELRYNPAKWRIDQPDANMESRATLVHRTGDAYCTIIVEQTPAPFNILKDVVLQNARNVDPNAAIIKDEIKTVNGKDILYINMKARVQGIDFLYHGHYWSGQAGAAQVFAYTSPRLEPDLRADIMELLDGFVINDGSPFTDGSMGSGQ